MSASCFKYSFKISYSTHFPINDFCLSNSSVGHALRDFNAYISYILGFFNILFLKLNLSSSVLVNENKMLQNEKIKC